MGFWDGSGISWTICKQSAPRSRQITTPTSHQSIFTDRVLFLALNEQCQSTEGTLVIVIIVQNAGRDCGTNACSHAVPRFVRSRRYAVARWATALDESFAALKWPLACRYIGRRLTVIGRRTAISAMHFNPRGGRAAASSSASRAGRRGRQRVSTDRRYTAAAAAAARLPPWSRRRRGRDAARSRCRLASASGRRRAGLTVAAATVSDAAAAAAAAARFDIFHSDTDTPTWRPSAPPHAYYNSKPIRSGSRLLISTPDDEFKYGLRDKFMKAKPESAENN